MLKLAYFNSTTQPWPFQNPNWSSFETSRTSREVSLKRTRILALYPDSKIKNLEHARSALDRIKQPSLLSWNTIIKYYVDNQRSHEAILLFREFLIRSNIPPDNYTLPSVIKGCTRLGAIKEAKQIHGLALKIGFAFDLYVQSSLVSVYCKCGHMDSARHVFDKMLCRDVVTWNSMIDGCVKCGDVKVAMELFEQMPERDVFSWTMLVDGLSKIGQVEDARQLFDKMPNRNLASWNAIINGYMKSGDFKSAQNLFDQMEERNIITWNTMISGYDFNKRFLEALDLFNTMLNKGFKPNNATLVSTLSAVSGLALLHNGKLIHSYIAKNGYDIEGVLGTLLIEMYYKCGSIENALTFFRAIPDKKLGHWTSIIVGLGVHGMAKDAVNLFNKMLKHGLEPNPITFIGVLNACSHAGLVSEGRKYFNMINKYKIKPTIEHYGCLVDILCRAGHLQDAKNVVEKMRTKPNKVIWMSILSGSRSHKNVEMGEHAAEQILKLAPNDTGCLVLLSNMYAAANQWDKVSKVRESLKKSGLKKEPGCSLIEHKGVIHEFIVGDKSHDQIDEISLKLVEMQARLKSLGYVADTSQVLLNIEDEEAKKVELESHSERYAIAFGLINVNLRNPIRIIKNLRVCNDCHEVTKLLSKIYGRKIIVRDNSRFHHFENGECSCCDYW